MSSKRIILNHTLPCLWKEWKALSGCLQAQPLAFPCLFQALHASVQVAASIMLCTENELTQEFLGQSFQRQSSSLYGSLRTEAVFFGAEFSSRSSSFHPNTFHIILETSAGLGYR